MQFDLENIDLVKGQPTWAFIEEQPQENQEQPIQEVNQGLPQHQELTQSKERLINFIRSLGDAAKTQIRLDVLQHVQQLNRNRRIISSYMSDETVMRMVACRIDKMLKNKRLKKNWSQEDVKILIWVVSKYSDQQGFTDLEKNMQVDDWHTISQFIPGVTSNSCMFKWLSLKKVNLSSHCWGQDEGNLLQTLIKQNHWSQQKGYQTANIDWKIISEDLYRLNQSENKVFRSAKQCRQHWNCFLNPNLKKGPWKLQQDIQLLTLIRSNNGDKKWSQIVYSFQGRTQNALKNRYTLLIDKQRKLSKSKQELTLIDDCLIRCCQDQANSTTKKRSVFISQIMDQTQRGSNHEIKLEYSSPNDSFEDASGFDQFSKQHTIASTPFPSNSANQSPVTIFYCKFQQFQKQLMKNSKWSKITPGYLMNGSFKPEY